MASSTPEASLTDMETTTAGDFINTRSDSWFTVYYRGHRLRAIPTAKVDLTTGNHVQPAPPVPRPQKKPQRLPPLLRGEFKVVMRPRDGLNLSNWKPYQVARHINKEAKITIEELHAATKLQLNHDRNIVIVSTTHIEVVQALTQIHHLRLGGRDYPTYTYVASPYNSIKGVVHDIEPGSTPEKLLHHLEAPGYRMLHARLLGNTGTALVTFEGRKIHRTSSTRARSSAASPTGPSDSGLPNPEQLSASAAQVGGRSTEDTATQAVTAATAGDNRTRPAPSPARPLLQIPVLASNLGEACPGPNRHQPEHPPNRKPPLARLFNRTTPGRSPTPTRSRRRKGKAAIALTSRRKADDVNGANTPTPLRSEESRRTRKGEKNRINILIRKAFKIALGLPLYAATDKLLAIGVHNTFQELIQAHLASQQERLALTPTGRTVLQNLHFPIRNSVRDTVRLPTAIGDHIQMAPVPKNMHPILHSGRRIARARALQYKYSSKADTRFTDAAMYSDQPAAAVSVTDNDLKTVVTASIHTINPVEPEETAIALAIASGKEYLNVLSDSQTALRRFRAGRISPCALRILTDLKTPLPETTLIWTPGHESTWEAALLSSHPDDKRSLVERAKASAASTGALD
ncbi:hypothetical protein HPB47_012810 [Ixodes persulcatus]|uniref:Uncharacterized protein n=1 Tax=Ixodes persulcatus TaxID=34615 RepID=A0AC60NSI8_IXOPE|nr:hypothetical protein HPB47_012810 [Ixodes persulcatus]